MKSRIAWPQKYYIFGKIRRERYRHWGDALGYLRCYTRVQTH
jgi:hypothetical protein